jgi:adenine-specific DNA methylase
MNKKLIEVALPLGKINAESAREKSIRHATRPPCIYGGRGGLWRRRGL